MLAKTYQATPALGYTPGMLVQPKLDGLRCLYHNGTFMSRSGEVWSENCLQRLRVQLAPYKGVILDGELYQHGTRLQTILRRATPVRCEPHPEEDQISFWVFDFVSRAPAIQRLLALRNIQECEHVKVVPTHPTTSSVEGDRLFEHYLAKGYEGIMYRTPLARYPILGECPRKDCRVADLLKRKTWSDMDCTILGQVSGEGKHAGTCSGFVLQSPDGVIFTSSSGPSDVERKEYHLLGDALVGQTCRIEYRYLTASGIPGHTRICSVSLPPNVLY